MGTHTPKNKKGGIKVSFKEYQLEIIELYDNWIQKEEKRGVSYGEIAYIESLKKRELEEIEKELNKALSN